MEVTLKSIESRKERCIQEGVLGLGPKTEYLLFKRISVKEGSRFQKRLMISQVERTIAPGLDCTYEDSKKKLEHKEDKMRKVICSILCIALILSTTIYSEEISNYETLNNTLGFDFIVEEFNNKTAFVKLVMTGLDKDSNVRLYIEEKVYDNYYEEKIAKNENLKIDDRSDEKIKYFTVNLNSDYSFNLIVDKNDIPYTSYVGEFNTYNTMSNTHNEKFNRPTVNIKWMTNVSYETLAKESYEYGIQANNDMSTAQQIYDGTDVYGSFPTIADTEYWYKIIYSSSGYANFWMGQIPSGCDYDMYIYNSSGTEIAKSDKSGSADELIQTKYLSSGTYYIKIKAFSSGRSSSQYRLRVKKYPNQYEGLGWSYVFTDSGKYRNITSGYKLSERPDHYAIDLNGGSYSISEIDIKSPYWGVVQAKYDLHESAGNYIVIKTTSIDVSSSNNLISVGFMHMKDKPAFSVGSSVNLGTVLGKVGNTGYVDPPGNYHLHLCT
jgi:murein DD-endopeptidase MepM/ murein hydrolase activator NlpD